MNHNRTNRKFGRPKNQREALLKSLALSLIIKNKIRTTEAKAKELRPFVEKLITLGKLGTLASKRLLISRIGAIGAKKVYSQLSPKYMDRKGGYTRITKLTNRITDGSKMAVIEFI